MLPTMHENVTVMGNRPSMFVEFQFIFVRINISASISFTGVSPMWSTILNGSGVHAGTR